MAGQTTASKRHAAAAARKAAAEARKKAVAAAAARRRLAMATGGSKVGRWMGPKALGAGMSGYSLGCVKGGYKPDRGAPMAAAERGLAPPLSYAARPTKTG